MALPVCVDPAASVNKYAPAESTLADRADPLVVAVSTVPVLVNVPRLVSANPIPKLLVPFHVKGVLNLNLSP